MEENANFTQESPIKKDSNHGYKKFETKAKEYVEDKGKSENLIKKAIGIANENKDALVEVWEKLQLLFEVVRAWIQGEYKEIPKVSIIMIITSILYFVSPVDLIPDFIVGLGFFDDAAVIGYTIKQISDDLEKFKSWKETKKKLEV